MGQNLSLRLLKQVAPAMPDKVLNEIAASFIANAEKYGITTPRRLKMFLAQVLHESGNFKYTREIWGPTATQKGYEGRKDLGNVVRGDGKKFMGRGYMQTTGRANYADLSQRMFNDRNVLLDKPELLEKPEFAIISAMDYFENRGLNEIADKPASWTTKVSRKIKGKLVTKIVDAFGYITYRVNGWFNGYDDRLKKLALVTRAMASGEASSDGLFKSSDDGFEITKKTVIVIGFSLGVWYLWSH